MALPDPAPGSESKMRRSCAQEVQDRGKHPDVCNESRLNQARHLLLLR